MGGPSNYPALASLSLRGSRLHSSPFEQGAGRTSPSLLEVSPVFFFFDREWRRKEATCF